MASRFLGRLADGPPIVCDGGMGALVTSAVSRLRCPEEANLRAPESVVSVHVSFINAGAELIETNTFGANRPKLAAQYLDDELHALNSAAVKLAREAREMSGREVFIAGSIGPLGEAAHGYDAASVFAEQASVLEGRGVDLFMVETFFDLEELELAIEAVRGVSALPIVALLTFDEDGETPGGVTAREAGALAARLGLAAVGANHGAGPQAALEALPSMDGAGLPLAALPNLGLASRWGNRIVYPHADPEYFGEFAAHARDLGAKLVGGCCGTTPLQIQAIRDALDADRAPTTPIVVTERRLPPAGAPRPEETVLARTLREGRFTATVEINPPKGGTSDGMLDLSRRLAECSEVGFVDINDNPTARARMNALMAAVAIEAVCGIETIPHLTPRDTTIMGLESMLLGAHAAGVRNILSVTGDPPDIGDYPGSQGVYEVDSIGLCRIMSRLNEGESYAGKTIDAPTSFFYGVAVNPSADDLDLELQRFEEKLEAGARFAITQVMFDLDYVERFLERLGGSWPVPVLLGVFYVTNYALALRLHNEVPGIVVPPHVQERFRAAGPDAREVGLEVARELVAGSRELCSGVQVIPPFQAPLAALELLR
ncbi:MAG: bifunctional homocysteine S-methyltransferase/methylenetetrahydrofolate reductase [Gaiellaceae bacterium]